VDEYSLAPGFLVAMPQLLDPNFRRAVVLLVHHDESGTFGLVLSRASERSAEDLCGALEIPWAGTEEAMVHWGGPVQPDTGWMLLGDDQFPVPDDEGEDEIDGMELLPGVQFAGTLDRLRRVAAAPPARLRILLGYAGWAPGQLEAELADGAWLLVPASAEDVFDVPPDLLWAHVLRGLGIDPATLVATQGVH
jgi:putative transcriptional regulator